jgi:DNA polymerase-3 subunit delta'
MADDAHPKDVVTLEGIEAQAAALQTAMDRGRLHHAWLLTGPEGSGKASFAYMAARRLLGAVADPAMGPLGSRAGDSVSRLISAGTHPDLMVLEIPREEGKARKSIPIDEARRVPEFFANSPALAPFRVAIIDTADDLNPNSANAVLKTLEEPPARGVLFLVSNAPGKLLPTIRSRCRRLAFPPWPDARVAAMLTRRLGLGPDEALRIAALARGAPGRALALAAGNGVKVDDWAEQVMRTLSQPDEAALIALADGFRGAEGGERFGDFMERLADRARAAAFAATPRR